ncbi:MAG: glyoxalase/bleomycin resistance/dioxygenase family protein [Balneola sp.]|nr:glyoxalase/bleomycin resistance/dioxygenase family protein [Balneola sp.]|tara:strand:- start:1449 stop:1820 length:372 start_codon:yes stop_codon:yes gene_type:complete
MEIEHVAFNVSGPLEMSRWYVQNLGFEIIRQEDKSPFTTFMADKRGVMVEVYKNPADQVPDYEKMDPLILHLAFKVEEPDKEKQRLLDAGAKAVNDEELADGSRIIMLRDPWGLAIQLCKRSL